MFAVTVLIIVGTVYFFNDYQTKKNYNSMPLFKSTKNCPICFSSNIRVRRTFRSYPWIHMRTYCIECYYDIMEQLPEQTKSEIGNP